MQDDEARRLAIAAQSGSTEARNTLVVAHLGACRHIAQGIAKAAKRVSVVLSMDDLFSEAAEYLTARVVAKFDTAGPIPFRAWVSGHTMWVIRATPKRCLETRSMSVAISD